MSFIEDFPHTSVYDKDLGFLIKSFKELSNNYELLVKIYEEINKSIVEIATKILMEMLKNGDLLVELNYVEETKTLNMAFGKVGER